MASVFVEENGLATVHRLTVTVTSDGAGDATGASTYTYGGEILAVVVVPGTGGDAPSAAWDLTILDDNSIDLLAGAGADLSSTVTTVIRSVLPVANSKLTVTGANMGATNKATVDIWVR